MPFDIQASIRRAKHRLPPVSASRRKKRSDAGAARLDPRVVNELRRILGGEEYPGIRAILNDLGQRCAARDLSRPSRATVYKQMLREPSRRYPLAELPRPVQAALYNLSPAARVPGAQLAFYCFNYGELPAVQFAAGLPWLPLYQASRMRGWRGRSRGLLRAVLLARGIPASDH